MTGEHEDKYTVAITLLGDLHQILQGGVRTPHLQHTFTGRRSVKDLIESLGIPHTEIDHITINGAACNFAVIVDDGDLIILEPSFSLYPTDKPTLLRPEPLTTLRFVLDVHLGTLARRLRLLGFDTDYRQGRDDPELADISAAEKRILLTRDRRLLMRRKVLWGMFIRSTNPTVQTVEVLNRLSLWDSIRPYTRCINCNGQLYHVVPETEEYRLIRAELPDGVTCWCTEYVRCKSCSQIYWKGSHYDKMEEILAVLHNQTGNAR